MSAHEHSPGDNPGPATADGRAPPSFLRRLSIAAVLSFLAGLFAMLLFPSLSLNSPRPLAHIPAAGQAAPQQPAAPRSEPPLGPAPQEPSAAAAPRELPADLLADSPPPLLPGDPAAAPAYTRADLLALVDRFADEHRVERALAHAVVSAESDYDPYAVSRAGAIGLMQVMPDTAADYGVNAAEKLFDPPTNLATGLRHLRRLLEKYDADLGLAVMAYNAGEGALQRAGLNLTYAETLTYSERVIRAYLALGGSEPMRPTLNKLEQLNVIADAGIVKRIERKRLDVNATDLSALPELSLKNIEPRLRLVSAAARTTAN